MSGEIDAQAWIEAGLKELANNGAQVHYLALQLYIGEPPTELDCSGLDFFQDRRMQIDRATKARLDRTNDHLT
jgi:hypothetical protein